MGYAGPASEYRSPSGVYIVEIPPSGVVPLMLVQAADPINPLFAQEEELDRRIAELDKPLFKSWVDKFLRRNSKSRQ